MNPSITNVLTVDLEDYYMVSAFESVVKRKDWHRQESRIERNTHRILDILNGSCTDRRKQHRKGVQATFFCLGWIAEKYPQLIKEIDRQGHEIACHSYDHQLVYSMTPDQFRMDVRTTKRILEDITGKVVIGYRAPSYSITNESLWALRVLFEEGYLYDSSIFPIHHDRYGIPKAPRFPFIINLDGERHAVEINVQNAEDDDTDGATKCNMRNGSIVEFPISTVRVLGLNIPVSGGGYMRLFPYGLTSMGLKRINEREKKPFIVYIHPWEIDPEQPRIGKLSALSRFRHYINLKGTTQKLGRLLSDFNFSSMGQVIERESGMMCRTMSHR